MRSFKLDISCHNQYCIQAHDLTAAECKAIRSLVCNNWTDSEPYKAKQKVNPFLQGYDESSGLPLVVSFMRAYHQTRYYEAIDRK